MEEEDQRELYNKLASQDGRLEMRALPQMGYKRYIEFMAHA